MFSRNILVFMRAFCLFFFAIAANAATYSNIQEVIENESLILGYNSEAIDGLSVPPTLILEKMKMATGSLTQVSILLNILLHKS